MAYIHSFSLICLLPEELILPQLIIYTYMCALHHLCYLLLPHLPLLLPLGAFPLPSGPCGHLDRNRELHTD